MMLLAKDIDVAKSKGYGLKQTHFFTLLCNRSGTT